MGGNEVAIYRANKTLPRYFVHVFEFLTRFPKLPISSSQARHEHWKLLQTRRSRLFLVEWEAGSAIRSYDHVFLKAMLRDSISIFERVALKRAASRIRKGCTRKEENERRFALGVRDGIYDSEAEKYHT